MSKLEPGNREEAFAYQFADDVKLLLSTSCLDKKAYKQALETLKIRIATYEHLSKNNP